MRFSQTRRDLSQDPGASFSPKQIILGEAPVIWRRLHVGSVGRSPGILLTKTSAEKSLTPRVSTPKPASSCSAVRQRFEQRLRHLCGSIDGIAIAINPRNDDPLCTTVMSISASSLASRRFAISPSAWASRRAPARISWSSWKYRSMGFLNEASAMDDSAANLPIRQPLRRSRETSRKRKTRSKAEPSVPTVSRYATADSACRSSASIARTRPSAPQKSQLL